MQAVCDLAFEQCGIYLDASKGYLIRSRLDNLRNRLECSDFANLVDAIRSRPALMAEFVDAITTNETLFFRDHSPFQALQHKVIPELIDARASTINPHKMRIWSAGCSTGQEAYSIAITLAELIGSVSQWDIRIMGSDISPAAVEQAKRGVYSQWEVERGMSKELLQKYFVQVSAGWQVREDLRAICRFERRNMTKPFTNIEPLDVVFCRNMAIYFVAEERRRVFERVAGCMAEDGYLFVGSTELLADLGQGFAPHRHCGATFYRPNL